MNRKRSQVLWTPGYRHDEIMREPDEAELRALRNWKHATHVRNKLLRMRTKWLARERQHDAYMDAQRRKFAEGLQARVAVDVRANELQAAADAATEKVRAYYMTELDKELQAADKKRKEMADALVARIRKDDIRYDNEQLRRKGLVRGRRNG
jgi:hypothetical protein